MQWNDGPVPERWTGLWRRLSLEVGASFGDIETLVLWLQTDRMFVDLRIPAGPRAEGAIGFGDLTPQSAARLAAQEGFAGTLLWEEGRAAWRRAIDFRPLGTVDEGHVSLKGRVIVEGGLHADYTEHWWQVIDEPSPGLAALHEPGSDRFHVRAGDHVMFAEDRRPSPPPAGRLAELVEAAARRADAEALAALLDCEISYGRTIDGGHWRIERSTLPWLEGETRALPAGLQRGEG